MVRVFLAFLVSSFSVLFLCPVFALSYHSWR